MPQESRRTTPDLGSDDSLIDIACEFSSGTISWDFSSLQSYLHNLNLKTPHTIGLSRRFDAVNQ
jgi:hypothetical protein